MSRNAVDFRLAEEDSDIAWSMREGNKKEKGSKWISCGGVWKKRDLFAWDSAEEQEKTA